MIFTSYAQNYEDVILNRALKGVDKGFYIDVGAWDPVVDSVTKAFYERGWRGINVEPVKHWFERLVADRPGDINLNVAVSEKNSFLHFYDLQETGLSTFNKDLAEKHSINHGFRSQDIIVPTMTLDEILKKAPNQDIHFLKIDVEGSEREVLASINLKLSRPWIILVEATKPDSQEQDFQDWEYLLTDADYKFVYFDGLNRFYIPKERDYLASAFRTPPNIFDSFVRVNELKDQTTLRAEGNIYLQLETALNVKKAEFDKLQKDRDQILAELRNVYNSRSFRLTLPLRILFVTARNWRDKLRHPQDRLESATASRQGNNKRTLRLIVNNLSKVSWIANLLNKIKYRFPRLWYKLTRKVKETLPVQSETDLPLRPVVNTDDEQHFLNLFERELARRTAELKETK